MLNLFSLPRDTILSHILNSSICHKLFKIWYIIRNFIGEYNSVTNDLDSVYLFLDFSNIYSYITIFSSGLQVNYFSATVRIYYVINKLGKKELILVHSFRRDRVYHTGDCMAIAKHGGRNNICLISNWPKIRIKDMGKGRDINL